MIIIVIVVIFLSSLGGALVYWKRDELFGSDDEDEVPTDPPTTTPPPPSLSGFGEACSLDTDCVIPYVCDPISSTCEIYQSATTTPAPTTPPERTYTRIPNREVLHLHNNLLDNVWLAEELSVDDCKRACNDYNENENGADGRDCNGFIYSRSGSSSAMYGFPAGTFCMYSSSSTNGDLSMNNQHSDNFDLYVADPL